MTYFINSLLLGIGLAMDAFSVSTANGLAFPQMRGRMRCAIAGVFAFFQFLMPMIGWGLVHTLTTRLAWTQKLVPWIALFLLSIIGIGMIREGKSETEEDMEQAAGLTPGVLILQGIATSIDALSAGFALAQYTWYQAFGSGLIIAAVTFLLSYSGVAIGRRFGSHIRQYASILGGSILILIGLEIWVRAFVLHV